MRKNQTGKYYKETIISFTDAIIEPFAVMVETCTASIAGSTMLRFI